MSLITQQPLPGMDNIARRELTPRELMARTLENGGDPVAMAAVIKEFVALEQSIVRFQWEQEERQKKIEFDVSLNRCQARIERIATDANNPQTHSRYATYAKLDRVLRPIYTSEGFSLSFGEEDCPIPGKTRFVAYLSREGVTREYRKDMTASTKGPKGNDVMTPVHAEGALDSYARRYLLKSIFNVAVGEDEADGNTAGGSMDEPVLLEWLDGINQAPNLEALKDIYRRAYTAARESEDQNALAAIVKAYEGGKKAFARGGR